MSRLSEITFRNTVPNERFGGLVRPFKTIRRAWNFKNWKLCKNDMWVILTRPFVKFLLSDQTVIDALAYFEHTLIPDQSFLCSGKYAYTQSLYGNVI